MSVLLTFKFSDEKHHLILSAQNYTNELCAVDDKTARLYETF